MKYHMIIGNRIVCGQSNKRKNLIAFKEDKFKTLSKESNQYCCTHCLNILNNIESTNHKGNKMHNIYVDSKGNEVILVAKDKDGNITYNPVKNDELIQVPAVSFHRIYKQK